MACPNRLKEAEKQLKIYIEQNGTKPYSEELEQILERLSEIRADLPT